MQWNAALTADRALPTMSTPLPLESPMRRSAVLLLVLLSGCTTWSVLTLPAPADSAWQATGRLRLTTTDGRRILADTLRRIGDSVRVVETAVAGAPVLPLGAIARVEEQRANKNGTALLLLTPIAIAVVLVIAAGSVDTGY
jgi:hypothetical protein